MRPHFILLLALPALACRTEPASIVVEADTTAVVDGPARPVVVPAPAPADPEVEIVEEEAPAAAAAAEAERSEPAPPEPAADAAANAAVEEDGAAVFPAGLFLPAGLILPLELRTPLHSGSTRVGDRFAARTLEPVVVDGRTVLAPGVLVEGKVAEVVRANAEEPGSIEVDFRSVVLADGERVPLDAEIASVAGRPAGPQRSASAREVVGSAAGGAVLGGAVGGRRGAAIGAIVGAVGATLVAGATDHEVVVPPGTRMELVLVAPLSLPAPGVNPAP